MAIGDEDEIDGVEAGTEGQDTAGQVAGEGDQESDVSPEHADPEADDGEQEVVGAEPAKQPSRAEARFQRLANETKAAREEAQQARREAEELRRQTWQQNSQVTAQQEQERIALMLPEERTTYQLSKMQQQFQQERAQDRAQTAAMMDKTAFDAKATINPVYAKFKDEVEKRFEEHSRQGAPVAREILLKLVLGERALEGARNPKPRQQAAARVGAQRVASGSGKGSAAAERGKAGDSAAERLKDVFI